jgi:hypothetical protein
LILRDNFYKIYQKDCRNLPSEILFKKKVQVTQATYTGCERLESVNSQSISHGRHDKEIDATGDRSCKTHPEKTQVA